MSLGLLNFLMLNMDEWLNKLFPKSKKTEIVVIDQNLEYFKKYYKIHKKRMDKYQAEYDSLNKEKKAMYSKNNPKIKEYYKIYYQNNKEKSKESGLKKKEKRKFNKVLKQLKTNQAIKF